MAPTQTMNLVIAPDLAQDELPFLEHMGFKQAFTPPPSLHHHIKRAKPPSHEQASHTNPRFRDADARDRRVEDHRPAIRDTRRSSSVPISSQNAGTTASSSSSSNALPAQSSFINQVSSLPQAPQAGRASSRSDQELQASRITNFISRMKYLSDEGDKHEFTPSIFPAGGSLASQRSMIKSHAAKVKNELELKFQAIPYFLELDKLLDAAPGFRHRSSYNPLQIIRDRKVRPGYKQPHGLNTWQIPVSEMVQDMRWRYQCTKLKAQKLKRRQLKGSFAESSITNLHDAPETISREHQETTDDEFPAPLERNTSSVADASGPNLQHDAPLFNNPFLSGGLRRQSEASEGPTLYLPETSCGELIQRLRSSHGAHGPDMLEGSNSSSAESRRSSFHDAAEVDPLSLHQQPSSFRRQFCRNTASVADTRSRLRSSNDASEMSRPDDDLLKPLARTHTSNSQTLSMHSSKSSIPEMFSFDAESSSSLSLAEPSAAGSAPRAPVVTVTSDTGEQKLLDPLKRTPRATNLENLRPSSPHKGGDSAIQKNISPTDDSMNDPSNICTFGSIRPGHVDVRKAPWERAAHSAEEELEYYILLFKTALRRENRANVRQRVCQKYVQQDTCDKVSMQLKNECVPRFLNYLSGVEHSVVNQQQILDADFASSLDALRVTTDRMVSEVNTTLNKQVREMSSRMEKVTSARNCGFCTNASYTFLEYMVLSLMWVIWCVVKLWRILCGGFHVLRGGCSMFVIA